MNGFLVVVRFNGDIPLALFRTEAEAVDFAENIPEEMAVEAESKLRASANAGDPIHDPEDAWFVTVWEFRDGKVANLERQYHRKVFRAECVMISGGNLAFVIADGREWTPEEWEHRKAAN
jgi:hypothetical protein